MRRITFILISLITLSPTLTFSEVNEYDIEIVIFEDATHRYKNSEQWPRLAHTLALDESNNIITSDTATEIANPDSNAVINITNTNSTMLNDYVKKINASNRYNVLLHKSWRQTGLDAKSAISIPINSLSDTSGDSLTNFNQELPDNTVASSISGEIKVTLGRYLHIYTDLIYKLPNETNSPLLTSSVNDPYKYFAIKSHRRMRSKELHYLDHPLVGILVKALPVEKTEEDKANEEALDSKKAIKTQQQSAAHH